MTNNINYVITGNYKQQILKDIKEVWNKFNTIEDNIEFIINKLYEDYNTCSLCCEFKPITLISSIKQIVLSTNIATDEFYIEFDGTDNPILLEVKTKKQATMNDLDFLTVGNYTQEELNEYKVGETLSVYTQIPDTEMYFRFM